MADRHGMDSVGADLRESRRFLGDATARFDMLLVQAGLSPSEQYCILHRACRLMGDIRAIVARLGTTTVAVDQVFFANRFDGDPTGFMMATDRELLRRRCVPHAA